MITLIELIEQIEHEAQGSLDGRVDAARLVNLAGRQLTRLTAWSFLVRPPVDLNLIAGQDWIDLPDDFQRLEGRGVVANNLIISTVRMVSLSDLAMLRAANLGGDIDWHATLVYAAKAAGGEPYRPPTLAIHPTPTETSIAALKLNYRAGWRHLVAGGDAANVPDDVEGLLIDIVRAVTRATIHRRPATVELEPILRSQAYRDLRSSYGAQQPLRGPIRGGCLSAPFGGPVLPEIESFTINGVTT